ncbi:MAG TPA: DUF192 domain-containing protein [Acidobacteriota bacterium]|nr:DUF192 domain-containing protein [Acidobacteriota bacterium]
MLKRNKDIIASQTVLLTKPHQLAHGLMFHKPIHDVAYIFVLGKPRYAAIHMLFVFFPIDVLWLDESKKIIALKEDAKPFAAHIDPKVHASYIIELPALTIKKKKIKKGEKINF